jgi:hypothetical protein
MNRNEEFDENVAKTLFPEPEKSYRPWAQQRNRAKGRLLGMRKQLEVMNEEDFLVASERVELGLALLHINQALLNWRSQNEASKLKFGRR